jgi:hypothetical protein
MSTSYLRATRHTYSTVSDSLAIAPSTNLGAYTTMTRAVNTLTRYSIEQGFQTTAKAKAFRIKYGAEGWGIFMILSDYAASCPDMHLDLADSDDLEVIA